MKRFSPVVAVLVVFFGATVALASVQVGDQIRFLNREGDPGGEFGVALVGVNQPELFRTFCVEKNEFLDFSPLGFNLVGIDDYAVNGGYAPSPHPDPLSSGTKYLFWKFSAGTLSNYDYTPGSAEHTADANALQNAIWRLENEPYAVSAQEELWYTEAIGAGAGGDWDAAVKVMNITWATTRSGYEAGVNAQSCLVVVPEPATIVVWSLLGAASWLGLRVVRRGRSVGRQTWSPENRAAIYDIISR